MRTVFLLFLEAQELPPFSFAGEVTESGKGWVGGCELCKLQASEIQAAEG